MKLLRSLATALATALAPLVALAGQNAAPSSHLVFDDNFDGDIVINEVRVPEDGEAMYTYYETLGWRGKAGGYAGIQAHPKARNYIFSIWDHEEHSAPIRAVHRGPGTLTEKFGGEGTGLKSWNFELGWDTDVWYTLVSRCWPVGDHTFYGYWVRSGKSGEWTHMVTMDVAVAEAYFRGGTDAFIEDWLETGKNARTSHLRSSWKRKLDGGWHASGSGRYSVNSWDLTPGKRSFNFKTNWDGGVSKDETGAFYFMTAGGEQTRPSTSNPSTHTIARKEKTPGYAPIKLVSGTCDRQAGTLRVRWDVDPKTLPMFGYRIEVFSGDKPQGEAIAKLETVEPHARQAQLPLELPEGSAATALTVVLRCRDILDNESQPLVLPVTASDTAG